jgi:hypothetical protein
MPGFRGPIGLSSLGVSDIMAQLVVPPAGMFDAYTAYGVALSEVEVDVLTGW